MNKYKVILQTGFMLGSLLIFSKQAPCSSPVSNENNMDIVSEGSEGQSSSRKRPFSSISKPDKGREEVNSVRENGVQIPVYEPSLREKSNSNENNMDIVPTGSKKQSLPCGRSTDLSLCPNEETSQSTSLGAILQQIERLKVMLDADPSVAKDERTAKALHELNNITQAKQKQPIVALDDHSTHYKVLGSSIEYTAVEWEAHLIEAEALTEKKVEGSNVEINGTLPSFLKYKRYWQNQETVKNPDHDERQEVLQPSWPYNTSVRLIIEFPKTMTIGSGTIVLNNRTILTAGHCIYDDSKGGFADSITVEYRNDQNSEWSCINGKAGVITSGWFNWGKPSCDYGLIILEKPVGINCMGLAIEDEIDNLYINTAGFPKKFKDRIVNTFKDDPCLYASFGVLKRGGCPLTLYHSADTKKGQSGSGLWTYDKNHKAYCCGIHTAGFKRTEDNKNNKGILISSVPFQRIYQWIYHAPTLAIN